METKTKQNYQSEISTKTTPEESFDKITRVQEWWSKNFEGNSKKANDVFTVSFSNGDMYKIRIAEIEPDKRIVWDVIDAYQGWVKDTAEWRGTKIAWEIKKNNDGVSIDMTHVGLVPEIECFSRCKRGWDYLMHESLSKFLSEGKGLPV